MKLAGDFVFEAAAQDVWDALFDPQVLAAVLPGCEKLERVDGSFIGEIKIKIGPIQGKFAGKVDLVDIDAPKRYRMLIDGRGAQGFVKADATIELAADGDVTRIHYDSDAQVGGKIASVGQRLVETSARAIVQQSLENLHENIKIRSQAMHAARAREAVPPPPDALPETRVQTAELPAPEPAPTAEPHIEYKRADPAKLATAVAKEVGKSLLPIVLGVAAVVALVIFLATR